MQIQIKLRELLIEKNVTQKELAEMTGLREATISEIVNNSRTTINKKQLLLIMNALEVHDLSRILQLNYKEEGLPQ